MPAVLDLRVIKLPSVPVIVKVPPIVKTGVSPIWLWNSKVFAAPIPETEKLLKVVVPVIRAELVVEKATLLVSAVKPVEPALFLQLLVVVIVEPLPLRLPPVSITIEPELKL